MDSSGMRLHHMQCDGLVTTDFYQVHPRVSPSLSIHIISSYSKKKKRTDVEANTIEKYQKEVGVIS